MNNNEGLYKTLGPVDTKTIFYYIYCIYTVYTQSIHSLYTVYIQSIYSIYIYITRGPCSISLGVVDDPLPPPMSYQSLSLFFQYRLLRVLSQIDAVQSMLAPRLLLIISTAGSVAAITNKSAAAQRPGPCGDKHVVLTSVSCSRVEYSLPPTQVKNVQMCFSWFSAKKENACGSFTLRFLCPLTTPSG